jgi:probable HAF family extracellular repeat protein
MNGIHQHFSISRKFGGAMIAAMLMPFFAASESEYDVIELGTLGGSNSAAFGMNDRGQVVGWSLDSSNRAQAFVWQNGTMTGLGFSPGGNSSVARAINNNGLITGYASSPTNAHAFLFITNTLVDIGTVGGARSWGYAINDQGDIAGSSRITNSGPSANDINGFLWRSNSFTRIRSYHEWYSCDGFGMNESRRICGTTFLWAASERWWAYVWFDNNSNGVDEELEMMVLGALGGTNWNNYTHSGAYGINDLGQVVGYTTVATNTAYPVHAFLVTPSNGWWKITPDDLPPVNKLMKDLGTLDGFTNNSYANAINNSTWIVGTSSTRSGTNQAFLWRNGVMTNLNKLIAQNSGWVLTNATAINEANEIAGSGLYNGQTRAFVLTQRGRITGFDPVIRSELFGRITNEFNEVVTQTIHHLDSHVIRWSGIWETNSITSHVFTVEFTDSLQGGNWIPYAPATQWPISVNVWNVTNFDSGNLRYFRIRAE